MSRLKRAMEAANERKSAGFGIEDSEGLVLMSDSEARDRAVYSGFDIEYGELTGTSMAVAELYSGAAQHIALRPLFVSAWCDGLLTGMLLASLPPTPDSGGDTGVGGEEPE